MKRTSDKRKAENEIRWARLVETFGPGDEWTCQFVGFRTAHPEVTISPSHKECWGPIAGHEIIKRSRGGSITDMSNVALLCQYHNDWVEMNPIKANELGLADHARPISKTTQRINALNKKNHPGEAL